MVAKLALSILVLGVTSAGLLALRHSKLAVAHELAKIQLNERALDEHLFALRADIGGFVTPERVGAMIAGKAELRPLIMTPSDETPPDAPVLDPRIYVKTDGRTLPASRPADPPKPAR
jgi:hypothetical protein